MHQQPQQQQQQQQEDTGQLGGLLPGLYLAPWSLTFKPAFIHVLFKCAAHAELRNTAHSSSLSFASSLSPCPISLSHSHLLSKGFLGFFLFLG